VDLTKLNKIIPLKVSFSDLKLYNFNFIASHVFCNAYSLPLESKIENNQKCPSNLCAVVSSAAFVAANRVRRKFG
jgi:hypothetical protein